MMRDEDARDEGNESAHFCLECGDEAEIDYEGIWLCKPCIKWHKAAESREDEDEAVCAKREVWHR